MEHRNTRIPRRRAAGFTMVELMVVIVILGLLATLVGTNVLGNLFSSQVETAKMQVIEFEGVITNYFIKNREIPESFDVLIAPDEQRGGEPWIKGLTQTPQDPWGNEYIIRPGERRGQFEVISFGPDGMLDSDDDISSRTAKDKT